MRITASVLLVFALSQNPAAPATGAWPPPGVLTDRDGIVKPEVVTKIQPTYTRDAMRALIQGFVTLQFVVEPDGSVGPVRVVRSLDAAHGLDDAAIAALKQWRFKPGTKDGVPVRALSNLLLAFTISGQPPPMTLPAGFDTTPAPSAPASGWVRENIQTGGVVIDFAYPDGWTRHVTTQGAITATDTGSLHSVGVTSPGALPAALPFPLSVQQLAQFTEVMRLQFSRSGSGFETTAAGQSALGNNTWLWLELEAASLPLTNMTPELAAQLANMVGGAHVWSFNTTVGSRLVEVMCVAPALKNETPADRTASLASAAAECAGSIKRMTLTAR
jgi:TonB family protein